MNTRQKISLLGSAVLIVGVFFPILSAPLIGNITYFKNGQGDGVIVLAIGVISAILAALDLCGWLWITGFGALGITLFDFVNAIKLLSEAKGQFHQLMNGNIFQGFADLAANTIQLQWGWAVVILGSVLVVAGAATRDPHATSVEDDSYSEEHSIAWPLLVGVVGLGALILIGAFVIQGIPPQRSSQNHAAQIKAKLFSDPSLNRLNIEVGESDEAITLTGTVPDYSVRLKV